MKKKRREGRTRSTYFQQVVMDFGKLTDALPRARTYFNTRAAAAVDTPPAPSTTARKSKISLSFAERGEAPQPQHRSRHRGAPITLRNSTIFWFFECVVRAPIVVVVVRGQRGPHCAHPLRRRHRSSRSALSLMPGQRKSNLELPQTNGARARHVTHDGPDKDEGRTRRDS
jgi:hypothetical protein